MNSLFDYNIEDYVIDGEGNEVQIVDIITRRNRQNIVEVYDEKNGKFKVVYENTLGEIVKKALK